MDENKRKMANMFIAAAMTTGIEGSPMLRRHRVKTFRNGPCEQCGQPNVRRGRETGVYLCEKHFKEAKEVSDEQ